MGNLGVWPEKGECWYVAVATSPKWNDFHFYRQDSTGCWSHKVGHSEVTNLDDMDHIIASPESAKVGDYMVCAYLITNRNITIR